MARRHRRREIERLLRKREREGLTYRELSEESGIPIGTLAWWSRRLALRSEESQADAGARELVAVEVIEDEREERGAVIEILVGDGVSVRVPSTASEGHLRRVLRAVSSC